jgi:hypothetical protein
MNPMIAVATVAAALAIATSSVAAQTATTSTTTTDATALTATTSTAAKTAPPTTATPQMISEALQRSKARHDKFLAKGTPEQWGSEEPFVPDPTTAVVVSDPITAPVQ